MARAYKLCDFLAHDGAVNCVRIGRGTAGVLATGGEDKKVQLWRTGQTEPVKSLIGLQSSVECVVFGEKEDTVAAGGANGTVKLWDMDSGKMSRSLTGHRANCLSLAFTSSDTNCLVSSSLDCNVKVWDLRRKEAIVTFKGHKAPVLKVAPSPDNKWVASGSDDGELKVWDITSGRVVKEGWRHNGRITGLEFNPNELLLASSGADKTVRVWDLEVWEEVECLGPEATAVLGVAYASDATVLLSATADALKVWGLDPTQHFDTVPHDLRNLADLHMCYKDSHPRALACCRAGSMVGVYMVDMRKVAPYCSSSRPGQAGAAEAASIGTGGAGLQQQQQQRGSSKAVPAGLQDRRGPVQLLQQQQQPVRRLDAGGDPDGGGSQAYMALLCEAGMTAGTPDAAAAAGPLTRQLPRGTPPRPAAPVVLTSSSSANSRQPGFATVQQLTPLQLGRPTAQVQPAASPRQHSSSSRQQQQQEPRSSDYFPEVEIRVAPGRPPAQEQPAAAMQPLSNRLQHSSSTSRASSGLDPGAASVSQLAANLAATSLQQPSRQQQRQRERELELGNGSSGRQQEAAGAMSATLAAWLDGLPPSAPEASTAAHSKASSRSSSVPASRTPSRQNMTAMQQQLLQQQQAAVPASAAAVVPADPILAAMAKRPTLKADLARMLSAVQVAKGFAARGNLEGTYKSVLSHNDPAIACMVLEAVSGRADAFELNSLEPLIKLLELLLASGHEQQVAVGLSVLGLVLRGPGQTVADVCSAPQPPGVDLSFEERRTKCQLLRMALEGLGLKVGVLSRSQGPTGMRARLLATELKRVVGAG